MNLMIVPKSPEYDAVIQQTLAGLDSESSQKQYGYTYDSWGRWCAENNFNVLAALNMRNITQYLKDLQTKDDQPVSFTTRQNHLSHLRKMLEMLAIYSDAFKQRLDEVKYMKTPRRGAAMNHKEKKPLTADEVMAICTAWMHDTSLKGVRNHAAINLTFSTGARISEICVVQWQHINEGVLLIPHGKGDKRRHATIIGDSIPVFSALEALWITRHQFTYAFSPTLKSGAWGADRPVSRQAMVNIIQDTIDLTGIDFHHHLARFTLGTELIENGGEGIIRDVMEQFGHSHPETLLKHYVAPGSAEKRRSRFKTSW